MRLTFFVHLKKGMENNFTCSRRLRMKFEKKLVCKVQSHTTYIPACAISASLVRLNFFLPFHLWSRRHTFFSSVLQSQTINYKLPLCQAWLYWFRFVIVLFQLWSEKVYQSVTGVDWLDLIDCSVCYRLLGMVAAWPFAFERTFLGITLSSTMFLATKSKLSVPELCQVIDNIDIDVIK